MKNHVVFVDDHSGSMDHLTKAAINDYNSNIKAVAEAASREKLDTVVSVVSFGIDSKVKREVIVSNPHVLKPINHWETHGQTPLWDALGDAIELLEALPDSHLPNVSYLVSVTTDGGENASRKYNKQQLANKIRDLQATDRWTFVCRVPKGQKYLMDGLNIPSGNIVEWETTTKGMEAATIVTTQAMDSYFAGRSAGSTSSNSFYANAANVNTAVLKDITKEVSLYVVQPNQNKMEIRDFILTHRMNYLKGAAFYQLTKTESKVSHKKLILVRQRSDGKVFAGNEARQMLGLPTTQNCRLHPGDHKDFDIFIQSESVNRHLVAGTGVLYWPAGANGVDQSLQTYEVQKNANGAVVLPAVQPTNKPTPNPLKTTKAKVTTGSLTGPTINGVPVRFFPTRDAAREVARVQGKTVKDAMNMGLNQQQAQSRWFIEL